MGIFRRKLIWSNLQGFVAQGEIGRVCRLRKSLYDLKQSPRTWFGKFSQVIKKFDMLETANLITLSLTKILKQVSSY